MSWEFPFLSALIDCCSGWVRFTAAAEDELMSHSNMPLYYLTMIKAEMQWEEFNQKLCVFLFIVGKRCVGAVKSRLLSVGVIFKDTHTHTLTHLPDSLRTGVATLVQFHKTSGTSCCSGSSGRVDCTIGYQRCVIPKKSEHIQERLLLSRI